MLNASLFLVFMMAAVPTVMSPGPGTLMSVTNCIGYGVRGATPGIFGVAMGTFAVALISATGLGLLLASSETAYAAVKVAGIFYLLYLGITKLRAKPMVFNLPTHDAAVGQGRKSAARLFAEGVVLQLSNPALIVFYISLFPQCIDPTLAYWPQFLVFTTLYAVIVQIVHTVYGWMAVRAAERFLKPEAGVWINRVTAIVFVGLALSLLIPLVIKALS